MPEDVAAGRPARIPGLGLVLGGLKVRRATTACLAVVLCLAPGAWAQEDLEAYYAANGLLNRGLYELAVPEYQRFLGEHAENEKAPEARYGLAVSLFRLGRIDEAADQLDQLRGLDGFEFAGEVLLLRGHCHARKGEHGAAADVLGEFVERFPDHPSSSSAAALRVESLYRAGKLDEAISTAKQAAEAWPDGADRDRRDLFWGLALSGKGDDKGAAELFAGVADRADGEFGEQALLLFAQSRHRAGQMKRAGEGYQQVLDRGIERFAPEALLGLAQVLRAEGHPDQAIEKLDQFFGGDVRADLAPLARLELGLARFDLGSYAEAREDLKQVIASERRDLQDDAAYWIGKCLLRVGENEKAATAFGEAVARDPDGELVPDAMYDRAVALSRAGHGAEAAQAFGAFTECFPGNELAGDALAARVAIAHDAGDHAGAVRLADEFAAKYADHPLAGRTAFLAGEGVYLLGDYKNAAQRFERFLNEHPDDELTARASCRLGMARFRLGDFAGAGPLLRAAAERAGDDAFFRPALLALGEGEFDAGDYAAAAEAFARFVALGDDSPNMGDALLRLGLARARMGEPKGAVEAFDTLIKRGEHVAQARFERGQALVEIGETDAARGEFEKLLAESPGSRFEGYALRHLGALARAAGDDAGAAEWFAKARRAGAADIVGDATLDQGRALLGAGKYDEAAGVLGELINSTKDADLLREASASRAVALSRAGRAEEAVAAIDAIDRSALDADMMQALAYERAWSLRSLGRSDDALKAYRALIDEGHETPILAHAMLEVAGLEMDAERYDAATDLLDELESVAQRVDAGDKVAEQRTYRRGVCAQRLEDYKTAADVLADFRQRWPKSELADSGDLLCADAMSKLGRQEEAVERFARVGESADDTLAEPALLGLGQSLATLQRWAESEAAYRKHAERFGDGELWFQSAFGIAWALEHQERRDEAIAEYREVTARHKGPTAARAQFQIGECLFAEGKHEEAARELVKVDILYGYPEWSAAALYEAGRCFEAMNQRQPAREQYERVVERYGDTEWAELAGSRLEALDEGTLPGRRTSRVTPLRLEDSAPPPTGGGGRREGP